MKNSHTNILFIVTIFLLSFINIEISIAKNTVTKNISVSAFGMGWKNSKEAKLHLLSMAKREAVSELFGEFIKSSTEVKNFVLTNDEIQSISAGFIRINGNPEYFNGNGFGEIGVKINAYITDEDINRFKPREVRKKVCIADPRLSLGEIRKTAERQARIQAVKDFEPKLERIDDDIIVGLIHEARTENAGFIPDTTTFCVTAIGKAYPVELMAVSQKPAIQKKNRTLPEGLIAYYPFKGNVNDESGNGNHGKVHNANLTKDRFGNADGAYKFNGKSSYIDLPVDINPGILPKLTMTAWVRADTSNPVRQVLSHDNGNFDRSINIDNRRGGNGWSAFCGTGGILGSRAVNIGEWVFLAVVYDQNEANVALYVNDTKYEGKGSLGDGWQYLRVGSNPSYGEYFDGAIDDIRIYNRSLPQDEIKVLYNLKE